MKYFARVLYILVFGLTMTNVQAASLEGSGIPDNAYLAGENSDVAVILCHGRGQHPTWDVVNPLRKGINEKLGYHTVSIQMPTSSGNWKSYERYFPDAYASIEATMKQLRANGVQKVFLMGHSMGSRMGSAYIANTPSHGIDGFIGVGIRNAKIGGVLDSYGNLESANIPTVDIYGDGGDGKDERHASNREDLVSDTYQQVFISGANHRFSQHEDELVDAVVEWLKTQI